MVVPMLKSSDLSELDTKQRILEAAMNLFAVKGFDGTSIRDIAKLAEVNVASLNYHFRTKENLRQEMLEYIVGEFKGKINNISGVNSASEYAIKIYQALTENSAKCVNQFKLILEADSHPCETDPYPMGYGPFMDHLDRELNKNVPIDQRLWLLNIVFSYIVHISVMSCTRIGKDGIEKFFPQKQDSIQTYITGLVEALVRDLNARFS